MLFHTWPFLIFLAIVLPVFFLLRKTGLWIAWLMAASYFFYGWWNPYYLSLVFYSTVLDYFLVMLMERCPREGANVDVAGRLTRLRFDDRVLKYAFLGSTLAAIGIGAGRDWTSHLAACGDRPERARAADGPGGAFQQPENLAGHQRVQQPGAVVVLQVRRLPGRESQHPARLGASSCPRVSRPPRVRRHSCPTASLICCRWESAFSHFSRSATRSIST